MMNSYKPAMILCTGSGGIYMVEKQRKCARGVPASLGPTMVFSVPAIRTAPEVFDQFENYNPIFLEISANRSYSDDVIAIKERWPQKIIIVIMPSTNRYFLGNTRNFLWPSHWKVLELADGFTTWDDYMRDLWRMIFPDKIIETITVPFPLEQYSKFIQDPGTKDKNLVSVSQGLDFFFELNARRLSFLNLLTFKSAKDKYFPGLKGLAFCRNSRITKDKEPNLEGSELDLTRNILATWKIRDVELIPLKNHYMPDLTRCYIGLHLTPMISQAQWSMSHAGMGIPIVGSGNNETHAYLYPDLCVDWYKPWQAVDLIKRLMEDDAFFNHCRNLAFKRVGRYRSQAVQDNMMEFITKIEKKRENESCLIY